MTALALAGAERSPCGPLGDLAAGTMRGPTGGGSVAPDLVLPPGFDRLGDVVRFEQDSGSTGDGAAPAAAPVANLVPAGEGQEPAPFEQDCRKSGPSGEPGASTSAAGDDPCEVKGATPSQGTDGRGPGLAPVERLGRIGLPGAVALEEQLAALRPVAAGRVRRFLASRGTVARFIRAEAIDAPGFHQLLARICRRGGPLADAIDARQDGVGGADLIPCTRCGLRGHVAGDPDRCLVYRGSYGLGGQAALAQRSAG